MSQEQDKAFFKNFTIVLITLVGLMASFMVLGVMFGGIEESTEAVAAEAMANTAPVAKVQIQGDGPEAQAMEENTK
jgi:hypothetical protein